MKVLGHIESRNAQAYEVLLHKLLRPVGYDILKVSLSLFIYYYNRTSIPGGVTSVLDVDNMDVQDIDDE